MTVQCEICGIELKGRSSRSESSALTKHLLTVHDLTRSDYLIITKHAGTHPSCIIDGCFEPCAYTRHGNKFEQSCDKHFLEEKNRKKFLKEKIIVNCANCDKEIMRTRRQIQKTKFAFCDRKCQNAAKRIGHPFYDDIIKKRNQTNLNNYGVLNSFQREDIKAEIREKSIQKYGVTHRMKSPKYFHEWREKFTLIHGYDHPMHAPDIRSRINWSEKAARAHETKKKNRSFRRSKFEDRIIDSLKRLFIIEQQKVLDDFPKAWAIDAYLPQINVYIQIDGSYWHGLDRPLDVIKEFKTRQDRVIYKKYLTDREQDQWFSSRKLVLLRLVDTQFQKMNDAEVVAYLDNLLKQYIVR